MTEQIWFPHYNYTENTLSGHKVVPFCTHMPQYNLVQHLLHVIANYTPETNMPTKLGIHTKYLTGIHGDICTYVCHKWSHWYQPCDQEYCIQMMPPTPTMNDATFWLHRPSWHVRKSVQKLAKAYDSRRKAVQDQILLHAIYPQTSMTSDNQ